jgi:hypothetical protein
MRGIGVRQRSTSLVRPLARAADAIAHNHERRRRIQRYRRVACVMLVAPSDDQRVVNVRLVASG